MIRITTEPFSLDEEIEKVKEQSKDTGGIAAFIGVVRGLSDGGEKIHGLRFEYYKEMAYKNFEKIKEGNDIMIPLGIGCYAYGKAEKPEKLLFNIGGGVMVYRCSNLLMKNVEFYIFEEN